MKNHTYAFGNKKNYSISFCVFLVVIVICLFVIGLTNYTTKGVVIKRVTDESGFLAKQQAQLIDQTVENEFKCVSTIAAMIENGLSFVDKKTQKVLGAVVETNELCMLAYADKNGNVITYQGKHLGNVADRDYFSEIMTEEKESVCMYLKTTKAGDEPRVIFAVPIKHHGKVAGVVFESKEISAIRNTLFQQSMFNNCENSMIIDSSGDILVRNRQAEEAYESAENICDIFPGMKKNLKDLSEEQSGSIITGQNDEDVVAYASVEQNNWHLICIVDVSTARQKYASSLVAIRQLVLLASVSFILGIIVFLIMSFIQMKNIRREYCEKNLQYERIVDLLLKMDCVVCEYDLTNGSVIPYKAFVEILGCEIRNDFFEPEQMENHKRVHPEFDFDGLLRELNYTVKKKTTTSFESIYCKNRYSYKILAITMMPVVGENGEVVRILGSFRETSAEHLQLKEKIDMFDQIPGGTYRYYLNYPMHLEYVGSKLCKMLGYTEEELQKLPNDQYINLVVEDDRERFENYLKEAASLPGVRTCKYGLYRKNGEVITVMDTMESIKNESTYMYGYSVVVDISEYARRQKIVSQEVEQLEHNLEIMRVNNSTSQMQPHFLYNALSSIREVVLQNPKYASDLIYDFTVYLRACIRTMQSGDLITVKQEINNICAYVNIEKMRMGDRLNVIYDLRSEDFEIAPLSIQPLVENAIRHGIHKRGKKGGTVTIRIETLEEYNRIIIEDNGVGFDYQKVRDEVAERKRESIGLDNVMFRLTKHQNAKVVIDSKIDIGTRITIWIPRERGSNESNNT